MWCSLQAQVSRRYDSHWKHSQRQCCHHQCWIIVLKAQQRKSWKIRSEHFQSSHKGCAWHGHVILQKHRNKIYPVPCFPGFPASWKPNQLFWAETRLMQLSSKAPQKNSTMAVVTKTYKNTTGCPYTVCCSCGSISMSKSDSSPSLSEEPLSTQSETSRNEPPKNGRRNSNHGHIATMLRATKACSRRCGRGIAEM